MRHWWHYGWSGVVIGALLLNVFWPVYPGYSVWAFSLLAYPLAAAIILSNVSGNRVGHVLAIAGIAGGVIFVGSWAVSTWRDHSWSPYLEAFLNPAVPVLLWAAVTLLYVFPTGTIPRRSTRAVFAAFSAVVAVMVALAVFEPGPLALTGRENPLGGADWVMRVYDGGIAVLVPGLVAGIWSLYDRWKGAGSAERAQMKWFMAGTVAVVGLLMVVSLGPQELSPPWAQMSVVAVVVGFWALPAAIVFAITRYHLYEIDRLIARTIAYAVVVGLLAAAYALGVVGLQAVLPAGSSDLGVAGSTLLVASAFNPVRRRVQQVVDRRFNRSKYRAAEVVVRMSLDIQDSVDPDHVVARLEALVADVLAPRTLAFWMASKR